ncbi:MAG TPA: bifunctional 4-hydroxy-2-oxoglutarate aldolase/2-dehydro-3-deoxy-phosphogluconate aldolase [Terriglobales bacterium]|jgi:2-dehydro-3-deoxyphosphogluconate aldolase/(4S)-4-hydroxy-2-oxoglutarate aldolase|nr:bifunctional 4-hydroxy-2-oxoglutarate aldolase/2-dehydro-3-deoxy-phosphogluconate aldolase [Terriglobales bacterium]
MTKEQVRQRVLEVGIVPVIRTSSVRKAIAASEAIFAGGISVFEITMTVPGAFEAITELTKSLGREVLIGAGTVLDAYTANRCLEAGATFLVTPGFKPETVRCANDNGILIMAGALTPTEILTAWEAGSDFVKVFPCSAVGGPNYIRALRGPLPQIPLVPTGGVNLDTAADFIRSGSAALGVGGELVLSSALDLGNTTEITELAKKYVAIIQKARQPEPAPATVAGK